jgi:hypothetical protein
MADHKRGAKNCLWQLRDRASRIGSRLAVAVSVGFVGALGSSGSALAIAQRGHTYAFAFGGEGQGAGELRFKGTFKLAEPSGIAVDEASGDVYVMDRANNRIDRFAPVLGPGGELQGEQFLQAFGYGVADGREEYETCTSACRAGIAGTAKGQIKEGGALAIDNSPSGHQELYVDANADAKRPDIQRLPANGEKALGKLPVEEEGRVDGLAVDQQGHVWLYRGEEEEDGQIEAYSDSEKPARLEELGFSAPFECPKPGLGVDATAQELYLDHELLTGEGECPAVLEREASEEHKDDEGKLARSVTTAKLSATEALEGTFALGDLERSNTRAIAVDQASSASTPLGAEAKGDVYLQNGGSIAAFAPGGEPIQRFGAPGASEGAGITIDAKTGVVFAANEATDQVDVFVPAPSKPPTIEGLAAQNISPTEAKLSANLDPQGLPSHYYFQYGTADCQEAQSSCTDIPLAPGEELAGGYAPESVSATLQNLAPSTTYYYRLLAQNGDGPAEGENRFATITTLPSPQLTLADHRAWEMVSPPEKDGTGIEAIAREGSQIEASAQGQAVTYIANGPVVPEAQGNHAPEPTQVLSSRSPQGWSSQELITPDGKSEGIEAGEPSEVRAFSSDLAISLLQPPGGKVEPDEAPALAPGVSEKTLYVRDDAPLSPEGEPGSGEQAPAAEQTAYEQAKANSAFLTPGYLPLFTFAQDTQGAKFGGQLEFLDATPDLGHVVFESGEATLLQGGAPGLYEWSAPSGSTPASVQLVSVLPNGKPAGELESGLTPELGDEDTNVRGAISADGSRVFFYSAGLEERSEAAEFHRLYVRDIENDETLQINAAQGVQEPVGEESQVAFQDASADGADVFFTDTAPLNQESSQRPAFGAQKNPADLYECQLTEAQGKLACTLKDLTPDPQGSAEVLNVLSGISEDGSSLYFVANGILAPGASQGDCEAEGVPAQEQRCNLYEESEGKLSFIAPLSGEDSGDWGSIEGPFKSPSDLAPRPDLADLTARLSPNGRYLAFMSKLPLTGYDNQDAANPQAKDQEVFLYDSQTKLLSCVSCNASAPSTGVLDQEHAGEGQGLLVDRRADFAGQYLAGSIPGWMPLGLDRAIRQPRYLTDQGRLFFDSPQDLVPGAQNHKEDVYEYEPEGFGTCTAQRGCISLISAGTATQESAFLEASEGGNDAFFVTSQPLVAQDHDTNFDLYDARVCTDASPCIAAEESAAKVCESTASCKPSSAPQPSFATPPTGTVPAQEASPPPTAAPQSKPAPRSTPKPLTRTQKLARALKACRRDKRSQRRQACERVARRRYGVRVDSSPRVGPMKAETRKSARQSPRKGKG